MKKLFILMACLFIAGSALAEFTIVNEKTTTEVVSLACAETVECYWDGTCIMNEGDYKSFKLVIPPHYSGIYTLDHIHVGNTYSPHPSGRTGYAICTYIDHTGFNDFTQFQSLPNELVVLMEEINPDYGWVSVYYPNGFFADCDPKLFRCPMYH